VKPIWIITLVLGILLFISGVIIALNPFGILQIIQGVGDPYYKENSRVDIQFTFDPGKVGESSSSVTSYKIIGGGIIVEKGSSYDRELNTLVNEVNNIGYGEGSAFLFWGDTEEAAKVRDLKNRIDYIGGRNSQTFGEISPGGGSQKTVQVYVPSVSDTYDKLVVYEFFCELGFKYINQWNCEASKSEILGIDLSSGFCGDIDNNPTPTDLIQGSSWDEHCFFRNKPSYCDDINHKCVDLCSSDGACSDGYCLGRYADTASEIRNLIDKWEQNNIEGTLGCVDKDKICKLARDCRAIGGAISDYEYNSAHCEKSDIPSWLEDTNDLVAVGAFGECQAGCKNAMDCTETVGDADNFKAPVFGSLIAGESWTCQSDGHCRLNICNHNSDCWSIQRTQMSKCESGSCERITCTDHYDCWDYIIIEPGLNEYRYGCQSGTCTFRNDFPDENYITPSLCEAAFGIPDDGKAWTVKDGKCDEEEIIEDECSPTSSQSTIQRDCKESRGEANIGFVWGCFRVVIDGKSKGVCSEVEIPVTENCQMADNPDEYCMYDKGVDTLSRGRKWICSENGICVLTAATCNNDGDCQVGSIGGTCIDGLCQYGVPPDPDIPVICGNGICETGEDVTNCEEDCGGIQPAFKWDTLYWLPILLTLGMSLWFGMRGKIKEGSYVFVDFAVGGVLGAVIGVALYYIFKYWVWITLLGFFGGTIALVIVLVIGGLPLLFMILSWLMKGRLKLGRGTTRTTNQERF